MTGMYTVQLGHGLGLIEETPILLDLWQEGMGSADLYCEALESGRFPTMTARRLKNLIDSGFAPRYLSNGSAPAILLKQLRQILSKKEFDQLLFLYTCRAHAILADFVREIYWPAYSGGKQTLTNHQARDFAAAAVRDGKTTTAWSDATVRRAGGYLTGCLADFSLLEPGAKGARKILAYRIEPRVAAILAYELHFDGFGDNGVVSHPEWALFGMESEDVVAELKRLAMRGFFIVQSAGSAIRIGWNHKSMEELVDVLAQG